MKKKRSTSRRGLALILALAALTVLTTGSVALAALAARVKLSRDVHRLLLTADDLLAAAEAPIHHWLARHSATIVLPPEAETPEALVLHDRIDVRGHQVEVRITAWDQEGMAPVESARAGSPLRLTLPEHVLAQIDETDRPRASIGLDGYSRPFGAGSASPFPKPLGELRASERNTSLPVRDDHDLIALGAYVSTHGRRINVNTAPLPLLEQAMRLAGRGGIELVIANRSAGRHTTAAALTSLRGQEPDSPGLSATSVAWSFRIDVRVGQVQRSWWSVYERAPGRPGTPGSPGTSATQVESGWKCVQRMMIRD